jgi:hypothetical protein
MVLRKTFLHQVKNQVEENTKPGKPNYAEKIELERTAEDRIVEDRFYLRHFQLL